MNAQRLWPKILMLSLCSALFGCASQTRIPAPVPPPLGGYKVDASLSTVKSAGIVALQLLGFAKVAADDANDTLVTEEQTVAGNSAKIRNAGIARLALERDVYLRGISQLSVTLLARNSGQQTEIRPVAKLLGLIEKRGDIRYAPFSPASADSTEQPKSVGVWEPLTSNGVLEDRFLAALLEALGKQGSMQSDESP